MIKSIWVFILSIPDLIKLIRDLQDRYDEHQLAEILKKDINEIRESFRTNDADRLNRVFNKTSDTGKS